MLLQFTVENCLSFRDRTSLSMVAAPGAAGPAVLSDGEPLSRVAAVYGPNASGKSNLVRAMAMARGLIVDGTRPGQPIERTPFKLDPSLAEAPSRFEFDVRLEGRHWSYAFLVDRTRVHAERLAEVSGDDEHVLFEREAVAGSERPRIEVDASFGERRTFLQFVAEGTRPNQLFLTELAERNAHETHPLNGWFKSSVQVVPPAIVERALAIELARSRELNEYAERLLAEVGTGITTIGFRATAGALRSASAHGPTDEWDFDPARVEDLKLHFLHAARNGGQGPAAAGLTLEEESDGTRRLLELAPVLHRASCSDGPQLVICDELDRSLHTLMTRHFLEAFLAAGHDRGTQLIFTTHDTNLLDVNLLPREAIWFVEKDGGGGSSLYSLAEFKPEQLEALTNDLERGYLNGRFGAVPFLGDPRKLGWTGEPASR